MNKILDQPPRLVHFFCDSRAKHNASGCWSDSLFVNYMCSC